MAALNCGPYVEAAVQSLLQQTYADWELLVADDCSIDDTRIKISKFKDPRIKCFHNDNHLGLLRTWNKLLLVSSGELLTWQDADDVSHPRRIEVLVAALDEDPELMLCGSNYRRSYARWEITSESNFPLTDALIREAIKARRVPFLGASKMIRREVLNRVPNFREFFDGLGWEDFDFILRVAEVFKVGNLPEVLYDWRYVAGSASRSIAPKKAMKLYIDEIGFFLADQRRDNNGLDGLMPGGPREPLEAMVSALQRRFCQDPAALQRRACYNALNNKDFSSAFGRAWECVRCSPLTASNHWMPLRVTLSYFKCALRYWLRARQATGSSSSPQEWLI